jgi:Zn-dependent protease/CBS domain-containing protein
LGGATQTHTPRLKVFAIMNKHTLSLGHIMGIPVGLDISWFLVFIFMTWSLASGYFPVEYKNWPQLEYWIVGAVTAIMLFVSVVLHELGHSLVALRYKIPVNSITLYIFGGIAQIGSEPPSATAEFWIAVAGPAVSFSLALLFQLLQNVFTGFAPLFALVKYLAYINGTLGLFNLIPGFPLDGGRVFRAIVWGASHNLRKATLIAAGLGRVIAYGFILFGVLQIFKGDYGNGLWIAFIGWFLESAASSQVQQQKLHDLLEGYSVQQIMTTDYATIPAETTLQDLVDQHILKKGKRCYVITDLTDQVVGILTLHHLQAIPKTDWPQTTAAQVMMPLGQVKWLQPGTPVKSALENMDRGGVNQLPVMQDGQILGMLTREDIISFLRTQVELGLHRNSKNHLGHQQG